MTSQDPTAAAGTDVMPTGDRPLPERFENPGLEPHQPRLTDTDPKAAKRAERQVAALFGISILGTLITVVAYFAIGYDREAPFSEHIATVVASNRWLGLGMFLALFGIGAGAIHWAKSLMSDVERTEDRHPMRGTDEERAVAVQMLREGAEDSALGRRPLIRNTLIGAVALAPAPGLVFLGDLGPLPGNKLSVTMWRRGMALVHDPHGGKIKASDLTNGSVVHVMPEGIDETEHPLEERAKAAVLLIRLAPEELADESRAGAHEGIVAYSKICTHMGCPVALYEQQTKHLLCPCHQSTFDIRQNCKVIFGPAKRPLPQLPLTVDDQGYLIAADGFDEPVGPSFWERG